MILYFTQSRGGVSPIRLEAEIQRLLLEPSSGPVAELPAEYGDLVGVYTADFGPFRAEPFEILWRDGQLALDIPSQFIFPLDPVGDEERWALRGAPAELDFVRDEAGVVGGLRLHQGGNIFDVPKGVPETEPEVALQPADVEPYLGWYREDATGREIEVLLQDGRLALRIPETPEPLDLFPPDDDGIWRLRMSQVVGIEFLEEDGEVGAYVARGPGGESTFSRFAPASATDGE